MKKRINKILLLTFLFLISVFAFRVNAVTITVNSSIKGTVDTSSSYVTNQAPLTVTGVKMGDQFKTYKLLDTFYNQASNEVIYEFTSNFKSYLAGSSYSSYTVDDYFKLTSGSLTSGSTMTTSTLDKLVSGYVSYIKNNSVAGVDMAMNGTVATATLDAGAYLVLPTNTSRVYATMVGNIDFEANDSEWTLNGETIVAKVSDAGVTKNVSGLANKNLLESAFTYTVVGTVPQYPTNATNKTYKIVDTLSSGIDFDDISNVEISDGTTKLSAAGNGNYTDAANNIVATVSISGQVMTIEFNLSHVTSTSVTVTYQAKFNDDVVLGERGNDNNAVLTYSNDPYGTGTATTDSVKVTTKAYGIEVIKFDNSDRSKTLSGAVFEVYSDRDLTNKIGTITTGSDGIGRLKGLSEGTYYLKETKFPSGYRISNQVVEVKVKIDGALESDITGYYKAEISNVKNGILPFTGGRGLLLYSLAGILIIMIGTVIAIKNQKKNIING